MFKKNLSTIMTAFLFFMLVIYIVIYPNDTFKAAYNGTMLWFNVVFPALLPFFICVDILIGLGIVSFLGSCFSVIMRPVFRLPGEGSFGFFMSIASGYPVGAKITASLYQSSICNKAEAQRMINLCSTSGPLFIIGAVATGIMHSPKSGLLLIAAHYLSAITIGFLMRFWGTNSKINRENNVKSFNPLKDMLEYRKKDGRSLGQLMGDAVRNGVNLIFIIGGFIILFSVIAAVLKVSGILSLLSRSICGLLPFLKLEPQIISSVIVGLLEITNGIKECAILNISLLEKLMLISFMIGFGGLSINVQVLSVITGTDIKFGFYCLMKLLQGAAAAFYTYIFYGLFGTKQAFNVYQAININKYQIYFNSSILNKLTASTHILFIVFAVMLVLAALLNVKRAKA